MMSLSATSDVAQSDIRCCTEQYQRLQRAISEVAESDTNQSIKQKQSTKPPTKEENRPPAIQPTVFKQNGAGEGIDFTVDEERGRIFEEFWAAYPERCPRKADRARCRQQKGHATFPQKVTLPFPQRSPDLSLKGQATFPCGRSWSAFSISYPTQQGTPAQTSTP